MKTNSTYYIDLISRYFYGEATPEEIHELEQWVKDDPANANLFSEYQRTWKTLENAKIETSTDLILEWTSLRSKLKAIADETPATAQDIQSVTVNMVNQKSKYISFYLRIAAIFLLVAIPTYLLLRYFSAPAEKQYAAVTEMFEQTLPDGTIVTLKKGATLSFPSRFEGSFRQVSLTGEAWFEVAHDKTKPFIISAGNVRIRVLGTSFFVNTKTAADTREVILAAGTVRVYYEDRPEKAALLSPGDKAVMTPNGDEIVKSTNDNVNFLSWKTKKMVFSDTPLAEVTAILNEVYNTRITLTGGKVNDCRITSTFDKQSLQSVLNVLKATLDIQVRNSGAGFEVSGQGCNQNK